MLADRLAQAPGNIAHDAGEIADGFLDAEIRIGRRAVEVFGGIDGRREITARISDIERRPPSRIDAGTNSGAMARRARMAGQRMFEDRCLAISERSVSFESLPSCLRIAATGRVR